VLNLHSIVRPAIQAVNPDTAATWLVSTGATNNADASRTPTYAPAQSVTAQVQPPSGKLLSHAEFLNIQGTIRSVYMFGNPQAISRVNAKGGDLLNFPQHPRAPADTWLVFVVEESGWNLTDGSWSRVGVVLQTDRARSSAAGCEC
jgi:hypothetical protein